MTNNDELAIKSEERIKAIANGAQMLMGESRQLAAAAIYWKEQARIATDAFQQAGIMQVKAEDKIEVLLAERDADKKRIAELEARTVSVKLPDNTHLSEAPEHIWLQTAGEWPATGEFSEITWCSDRQHPDDTLYVRADLAAGIKLEVGE